MIQCIRLSEIPTTEIPRQAVACFFIVWHINAEDIIQRYAALLLDAGCREFYFYGRMASRWHCGVDMADVILHQHREDTDIALTMDCDSLIAMAEEICLSMADYGDESVGIYVFFDDDAALEELLQHCKVTEQD